MVCRSMVGICNLPHGKFRLHSPAGRGIVVYNSDDSSDIVELLSDTEFAVHLREPTSGKRTELASGQQPDA
jgi:hypothetical protein